MVSVREPPMQARQAVVDGEWTPQVQDFGAIELGTVGWKDVAEHFDPGTPSNDGVTLVRVTLFRGRDPKEEQTPGLAQGTQVLARNSGGEVIPAKGTQVLVARPAGIDGPGCWHIIGNPGAALTPVLPSEGGTFFVRKPDGMIAMGTTTDGTPNGTLVQFQITREKFVFWAPWGKITFGADGFHILHHSGAALDLGGIGGIPSPLDVIANYFGVRAGLTRIESTGVSLGPGAGAPDNVARSTVLLALLGNIDTMLTEISIALSAIVNPAGTAFVPNPTPPGPANLTAAGTAAGALATNVVAFSSALAAAAATLPSSSTGAT